MGSSTTAPYSAVRTARSKPPATGRGDPADKDVAMSSGEYPLRPIGWVRSSLGDR
jgi:hypothetical protein